MVSPIEGMQRVYELTMLGEKHGFRAPNMIESEVEYRRALAAHIARSHPPGAELPFETFLGDIGEDCANRGITAFRNIVGSDAGRPPGQPDEA